MPFGELNFGHFCCSTVGQPSFYVQNCICLINFKFSTLLGHRYAFRESCLTCELRPLWESLLTMVAPFHVPSQSLCQSERLIGPVLNISENFQRSRSPHDQIWINIQIWILNSIQIYQVGSALLDMKLMKLMKKNLLELCSTFLKFEIQRHIMTRYSRKYQFGSHN